MQHSKFAVKSRVGETENAIVVRKFIQIESALFILVFSLVAVRFSMGALAEAVHSIPEYAIMESFFSPTVFEAGFPEKDKKAALRDPNHPAWSSYFHDIERKFCRP